MNSYQTNSIRITVSDDMHVHSMQIEKEFFDKLSDEELGKEIRELYKEIE